MHETRVFYIWETVAGVFMAAVGSGCMSVCADLESERKSLMAFARGFYFWGKGR